MLGFEAFVLGSMFCRAFVVEYVFQCFVRDWGCRFTRDLGVGCCFPTMCAGNAVDVIFTCNFCVVFRLFYVDSVI